MVHRKNSLLAIRTFIFNYTWLYQEKEQVSELQPRSYRYFPWTGYAGQSLFGIIYKIIKNHVAWGLERKAVGRRWAYQFRVCRTNEYLFDSVIGKHCDSCLPEAGTAWARKSSLPGIIVADFVDLGFGNVQCLFCGSRISKSWRFSKNYRSARLCLGASASFLHFSIFAATCFSIWFLSK